MLWRDGIGPARQDAARRRLGALGTVRLVFTGGVIVSMERDLHALVRSWPEVRVVGGVNLQRPPTDGPPPARTTPPTARAER